MALFYTCAFFLLIGYEPSFSSNMVMTLLFFLTEVVFFAARKLLKNSFLFLAAHIAAIVCAWFFVPQDMRVMLFASQVFLTVDSFYCRLGTKEKSEYKMHWAPAGLMCLLYFVGLFYEMKSFCGLCFYALILFLAGWFLQTGISRTNHFLEDSKTLSNVPAEEIQSRAEWFLLLFSALIGAVMLLAPKTFLVHILNWIKQGIVFLLSKVLGFVQFQPNKPGKGKPLVDMEEAFSSIPAPEAGVSPDAMNLLAEVIYILVCIGLVCAAVAVIIYVVKRYRELFRITRREGFDIEERIVPDKQERIRIRDVFFAKRKAKIEGAPENVKIRKLFFRQINGQEGEKPLTKSTPKELQQQFSLDASVRVLYEKARYSNEICSKAEVEEMKAALKR